ncbi:hypothetical protein CLOSPO_00702 [Clostridium sporogenes ATCC 15579]|nr:hypothetical protein CLOSPO_00702 [Clostridium sporogenes ATCC 15579]
MLRTIIVYVAYEGGARSSFKHLCRGNLFWKLQKNMLETDLKFTFKHTSYLIINLSVDYPL